MTAMVAGKQLIKLDGTSCDDAAGQKGNTIAFAGGLVMLDASGFAVKGQTLTGLVAVGVAKTNRGLDRYDATATGPLGVLADGVQTVRWDEGIVPFANSGGGDAILTTTQPGVPLYVVDDQTVALTNGSGTRSPAGLFHSIDAAGVVYVEVGKKVSAQIIADLKALSGIGAVLAIAANIIAPTNMIHHVGAGLIKTITPASGVTANGATLQLIPDAAFTYDATGNIVVPAGGGTATINKLMTLVFDGTKWTPNY